MSQVDLLPKPDSLNRIPQVIFFPHEVLTQLDLSLDSPDTLLRYDKALEALGFYAIDLIIHANALYNSADSIFLKKELLPGFPVVDLVDVYRDQIAVKEYNALTEQYQDMIRRVQGLAIKDQAFPPDYLRHTLECGNDMGDDDNNTQYYVPVLFSLCEGIYGVRLAAVTDLQQEVQIAVANLELLSKSYSASEIVKFEYFRNTIPLL